MIFTRCVKCDFALVYMYEAGDKGAGGAVMMKCGHCKTENYIELVSIGGETLSKEEFFKKHPNAKRKNHNDTFSR